MAKTCSIHEETPREKRRVIMAIALGWACLAVFAVLAVFTIYKQETYGTKVIINKGIDSLDFTWKCKTCGSDNHIKEVVR